MQDPSFGFGRLGGFGGGQTRVIRCFTVSNDPPTQLSSLDPFLTSRFRTMLPTTHRRFFDDDDDDDDDDDSPPSLPSKPDSSMITRHYYIDGFPAPFPSKVEPPKVPGSDECYKPPPKGPPRYDEYYKLPPKAPPRYDEYYKPPPKAPPRYDEYYKPRPRPRANPPGGYYGNGFYPPGGNPVNVHVNLHMGPQGLQAPNQNANSNDNANNNNNANRNDNANNNDNAIRNDNSQAGPPGWLQQNPRVQGVNYNPNGYYDSQTGWRQHNPQLQGGNYNPNGYYDSQTGRRQHGPQVQGGDYNPNGNYNSQTGGGQYNPQVQGGNKVDGDGKIYYGI